MIFDADSWNFVPGVIFLYEKTVTRCYQLVTVLLVAEAGLEHATSRL